jgi:hypothetical protein
MRLTTFRHAGETPVGLVLDGRILDPFAAQTNPPRDMIATPKPELNRAKRNF